MWDTVLFDLDGTLTDSGEGITKSAQYALEKEFGIKVEDPHELDFFVGPPLKDSFMEYAGLTEGEAIRAIKAYRERYTVTGIYENRLYDGIGSLLAALTTEGFQIALASSKPTASGSTEARSSVKRRRPAATLLATSSSKPGSKIGSD